MEVRERANAGVASVFSFVALILTLASSAFAQAPAAGPAQPMISGPIDAANMVTLSGNTRPEARNLAKDRGRVADDFAMPPMMLQMRRPAAQEQALETLIAQLTDPSSPNYHHWLTPEQIGTQFGPAQADIAAITGWLRQQGFAVTSVHPNRMVIVFSGTAGQVRAAFHTEIHNIIARGATRFANMSDPQIPAALAPAVAGVVGLNNLPPRPQYRPAQKQYTPSGYTCGPGYSFPCYGLVPADLATIYNLNPVFTGGNTGQGQTIYLLEDTDLYRGTSGGTNSDWATFRSTFGLSGYTGASINTVHPGCSDPNINGDDGEAILDAEWASAAAPSAAIVMVACSDFVTALNAMFASTATYPPSILSISYGECELFLGSYANSLNSAYQTGAALGWSIFVSAGDGGAAGCDNHDSAAAAQDGIAVSGFASSPYVVSVGGTDYSDAYSGTGSTYWNASNSATYGSAKSYIPEIPWNDSCGSQLFAAHFSFATTFGASGLCNSSTAANGFLNNIAAGSGGPSTLYTKPSWQSGFIGIVADGVRDQPDVSLFAASGNWGHFYVFCYSDPNFGGNGCSGAPIGWNSAGGTSFSSPIWAGFQALINKQQGGAQGLPNPRLYALAAAEYGAGGSSNCNSSKGNAVGSSCVFYDVTLGDMDVPCYTGDPNCYNSDSSTYGALSTSTSAYHPAYKTAPGWDFATGIGTVNVHNLVNAWASALEPALTVTVNGSGTVTSSPSGISCPSTCSAQFTSGTPVTLTPAAAAGWVFTGWSGACSGSGACKVTMNSAQSVTATFVQGFTLTVSDTGSGTVTSSPAGINCGSTCSAGFATGTQVTLTPTPAAGWQFTSWGGACSGSGSCKVTMSAAESVSATFTQLSYTLSVFVSGVGSVTSMPSGISCPGTCSASYLSGTPVTLNASPGGGATFVGWSGGCSGSSSPCTVTMNSPESIAATFTSNGGSSLSHTWVSSAGSDDNNCDQSAPCQTFSGAYAKTSTAGEISCANSSDFGQLLITHAITIDCQSAIGSQTSVGGSNTSGITIVTNSTDTVVLRGLDVDGLGAACSGALIYFSGAGVLHLQKMKINHGLGNCSGIAFVAEGASTLDVTNSDVSDNGSSGIAAGIYIAPQSGAQANVSIAGSRINANYFGVVGDGRNGGIVKGTVSGSVVSGSMEDGIAAVSSGSSVWFLVDQTKISGNSYGLAAGGSGAEILARNSGVFDNATGLYAGNGGSLYSYGNNSINGNATNGAFTGTIALH